MTPKFTPSQLILGKTASLLMHAIRATLKWESEGLRDQNGVHWSCGKPVIIAFWHSQQLLMPWIFREGRGEPGHEPVYAMVSQHVCLGVMCSTFPSAGSSSHRCT